MELMELIQKEVVTEEEYNRINESSDVQEVIYNGYSSDHPGYYWYTVIIDSEEYEIYLKA